MSSKFKDVTETIFLPSLESETELVVNYDYEVSDSQIEEGHGYHEVGGLVYTELNSIGLVIKIAENSHYVLDILPLLHKSTKENEEVKNKILKLLNYQI